jgi:hypothetical protein
VELDMKKLPLFAFGLISFIGLTSCAVEEGYSAGGSDYDALDAAMDEQQELEEQLASDSGCSS